MDLLTTITETRKLNNRKFRDWFRQERIPKSYHPYLHLGFNIGGLVLLIVFHFVMLSAWAPFTLGVLLFTFLLGNVTVWFVHKYPLHHRLKFWSYPFEAHTVDHHRYFTSSNITYDDSTDFYVIFFPCRVIAGFTLVAQPAVFFATNYFFGKDLAHALCGSMAGYFLLYELFHWGSHLPMSHFMMRLSWFRYMRQHHLIHHSPKLMSRYNFCIVYPMMDFLMGTKFKGSIPDDNHEDHYQNVKENI